ncbi:oxidoreductase-like protein [Nemania sp. NC0429]|nr:oxidoreductase-like protein [Nemania sp. NC0429]
MPPNMRPLMRVARLQSASSRSLQIPFQRAFASQSGSSGGSGVLPGGTPGESSEQAMPLGPYYEAILAKPQPIPKVKPEEPPTSSPKSPRSTVKKTAAAATPAAGKSKGNGTSGSSSSSSPSSKSSSSGTTTSSTSTSTSTASASISASVPISPAIPPTLSSEPGTAQDKARIIFGSRLAGPAERADRLQSIRDRSTLVAGVLVPPRPEEPDNCCMSGCVDCVWDRYRDEMEVWAAATTRAEEAMRTLESTLHVRDDKPKTQMNTSTSTSSEEIAKTKTDRPKIAKDFWDDDLYSNVPVGIREFMKHEKRLKKKHEEEGTFGG